MNVDFTTKDMVEAENVCFAVNQEVLGSNIMYMSLNDQSHEKRISNNNMISMHYLLTSGSGAFSNMCVAILRLIGFSDMVSYCQFLRRRKFPFSKPL